MSLRQCPDIDTYKALNTLNYFIMNYWTEVIFVAFAISALLTGIIIPQILLIAFRRKLFDDHDGRKIHKGIVPRLGGIAFFPSILCAVAFITGWQLKFNFVPDLPDMFNPVVERTLLCLCSITLLFLVGLADDLVGVRYRGKFIIQIMCAFLTLVSGVGIYDLDGLFGIGPMTPVFSWVLTGFVVVYIINAVNLIDGIDGLASGLSGMALMFYGWMFYHEGEYIYSTIAWASFGTLLPFFYYNVFGNPQKRRKIFMGDTGSLTIGMIVTFLALLLCDSPAPEEFCEYNTFLMAFAPLIIPVFDVCRVSLHRLRHHRSPFLPDRSHIHHKILALGLSSGKALSVILGIQLFFTLSNVMLSPYVNINILVGADILIYVVGNIWLTRRIHRREKRLGCVLYE